MHRDKGQRSAAFAHSKSFGKNVAGPRTRAQTSKVHRHSGEEVMAVMVSNLKVQGVGQGFRVESLEFKIKLVQEGIVVSVEWSS